MTEEDVWENFQNVHAVGRKDTKYMKFQKMRAPLLDRSACSHQRDYVVLPLGDNVINSQLAKEFKLGFKGNAAGNECSAKNLSSYMAEFAGFTEERTKSAKPNSFKPKQARTRTITGMTDLMETKPSSHVAHSTPELSLAKAAEIAITKPNLGLPGKWQGEPPKTSYKREFKKFPKSASAPQGLLVGSDAEMPSSLLPESHPAYNMRRVCYMSPGM